MGNEEPNAEALDDYHEEIEYCEHRQLGKPCFASVSDDIINSITGELRVYEVNKTDDCHYCTA